MGVKYRLPYRAHDDIAWHVDISLASYSGDIIVITGVSENACTISGDPENTDDPFSCVIRSSASLNFYDDKGLIDIKEIQTANDTDFSVIVYRDGNIRWQGFVIPDGVQKPMKSVPDVALNCTDGLSLLTDMPYSHNNLPGLTSDPNRCPMNYIRQILFSTNNLGIMLPIHWTNGIECTAFPSEDFFTGSIRWSQHGEGFVDFQSPTPTVPGTGYVYKTCEYILNGILKSVQCCLKQDGGRWVIRRVNDIIDGTFTDKSIAATLGIMTVTTTSIDTNRIIGISGYRFINENQLTTVRKPVKLCRVTYDANSRENILPNGSQDLVSTFFNSPFYWGIDGDGTIKSVDPIDGRAGSATELTNSGGGGGAKDNFRLVNDSGSSTSLPIDSYKLVKRIQFGFVFSPSTFGFPIAGTGLIDWSSDPFKINITYVNGTTVLYLDEFAIWRTSPVDISIRPDGVAPGDVVQIDFNKNNAIILPQGVNELVPNVDTCEIIISFQVTDGQVYTIDNIYIKIDENTDVFESEYSSTNKAVDDRTLEISSSWGGYFISNYMSEWSRSDDECYFTDGLYTGTLTGLTANAIMRFLYKSSEIYNGDMSVRGSNWSHDELYTIDSLEGKYMPLNYSYNTETCVVNLVAIECRSDSISLSQKHYGSNDSVMSN